MPDVEAPGTGPVAHLATPQWQSFEVRMRARRAERCLQRAADAIENGSLEDAAAALDEARQLSPLDPRVAELSSRLQLLHPAPPAVQDDELALEEFAPEREAEAIVPIESVQELWAEERAEAPKAEELSADELRIDEFAPEPEAEAIVPIESPQERWAEELTAEAPASKELVAEDLRIDAPVEHKTQKVEEALEVPARGRSWTIAAAAAGIVFFSAVGWQAWLHRDGLAHLIPEARPEMDVSTGLAIPTRANDVDPKATGAAGSPVNPNAGEQAASTPPTAPVETNPDTVVTSTLVRPSEIIRADASDARSSQPSAVATTGDVNRTPKEDAVRSSATPAEPAPRSQPEPASFSVAESRPPVALATPTNITTLTPSAVPAPDVPRATSAPAPIPAVSATDSASTAPNPSANLNPEPAAPASAPSAPASTTVPARDERVAVRAALNRYETAYNRLDVEAVRTVWPTLDQRALARAFDSLTAQRLSLQNCSVEVTGIRATANCSGNATWTPKVGGGERSASRKWMFDLSQTDGAWRITHVQAR